MAFPGPRYYSIRVFSSNTAKKLRMLPVTATADRPAGRSLSWSPGLLTASLLLISVLVSLWLVSPVFWDRLGGDSRAFYAAARLEGTGGDPYNFAQLTAEESRIDAAAGPPSAASGYSANPYHYPPAMTRAWEAFVPLGDRGFYWSNFAILLALGLLGMELILVALAWRNRWLVRVLLVVSPATTLVLVSGNPSTLLLAAWGGALLAACRNRAILAGSLLAVGWIKPPVGIPVAVAVLVAGPAPKRILVAGFGLGTAAFAAVNIAVAGAAETARWLGSLFEFTATLDPGQSKVAGQCCLAGLPALLLDRTSLPIAVAAAALLAGALLLVAHRRGLFGAGRPDSLCGLATLTALALVVTPYVHLNDLVLEALPVLVIASQPLSSLSRVVLVLWGLGSVIALAAGALVAALGGGGTPTVSGFGLALGVLTAVALVTLRPKAASTPAAPTQPAAAPV